MNLITLADARTFLKPFVDNGSCSIPLIDSRIAEIEERLWQEADWRMSMRRLRVLARNNVVVLPHNVLRVCAVNVDGTPASLASQAYEFSSAGPGDLDFANNATINLVDQGEFPTQFDVPVTRVSDTAWSDGLYLIAFSKENDDSALSLTAYGHGSLGDEIRTGSDPGETVKINRWAHGVEGNILNLANLPRSASKFLSVSRIIKPVTKGAVTLYAYNPTTSEMFLLSKMEPEITIPSYRRYRLTGVDAPYTDSTGVIQKPCVSLLLLVKMGWERATRPADVLFIQSLTALKLMAKAITAENDGQAQKALDLETLAIRNLQKQSQDRDQQVTLPVIWDVNIDTSLRSVNHGYLI